MTTQEYFNLLIETSKSGGFPATAEDGTCAYRGKDGKKCAVGVIIPDDVYDVEMEGKPVYDLLEKGVDWDWLPKRDGVTVSPKDLHWVQAAHDEQVNGEWSHEKFETDLKKVWIFSKE